MENEKLGSSLRPSSQGVGFVGSEGHSKWLFGSQLMDLGFVDPSQRHLWRVQPPKAAAFFFLR